ncbi:MAG: DUF1761 domain-containing protein [Sulfitobacter sp.]
MEFANVNWLAVIVGAVVGFLVGWLFYSPILFGKRWAEGSGVKLNTADKMPAQAMITQFLALFALSIVVGVTATANALITAILAILAAALFVASNGGFCKKSGYAIAVDFGYICVAGVIMIVAQGLF